MQRKIEDFLTQENVRNKHNAVLYTAMIKIAYPGVEVLIGHHLTFEVPGNLKTENEIPSADTMIFDYHTMEAIFGSDALELMGDLAQCSVPKRDQMLHMVFTRRYGEPSSYLKKLEA